MLAMNKTKLFGAAFAAVVFSALVSSCGNKTTRSTGWEFSRNMYDPIGYNPDQPNDNFLNGATAQVPPAGTTPVGFIRFDNYPNTPEGYEAAGAEVKNPLERNEDNLKHGAMLYKSFCSPCHGPEGHGDGTIVNMEKFPPPPSYATGTSSRGGAMKDLSDGKIYHTIYYGLNLMGSHASQLSPDERWKVVMYVHELQKK
ncbi:c-type cytochrome [Olivibacter sitiensis]|uniref:c-type cytochrome n=1 Tax=Olivibacter sitiensis TaxID=376470 RepID=UPI001FE038D6|nr:cytochrome c [Olivibacter sitiensis]